jgi:integrase/recombinase XerD
VSYEFSDEIRAFLQEKRYLQNISPKTITLYESCFKAFNGAIENMEHVKERVVELRAKAISPVTVNTYLRHIKVFYKWKGKEWKIPWLKEEQKILSTFPQTAVHSFINWKPHGRNESRLHTLVCLLFDTGLRISEALSLKKEDIDLDGFTLRVLGKGGKHRLVPFSAEFRKILFRYLLKVSPKDYVFSTRNNTKLSVRNFLRDFKKLGHQLGINNVRISPHTCRHSFAVNYIRKGGNLEFLRRILGHSSLTTTQKYLKNLGVEDMVAVHSSRSLLCG